MKDEPLKKCPKCGKKKLQRLFGAGAGIIFKGSGFYQTDYRSSAYQAAAKADKEGGKSSGNGTTGSTDSGKPGASSETAKCGEKSCKCDD